MKYTVTILTLLLLVFSNLFGAVKQGQVRSAKSQDASKAGKELRLVKSITPWTAARIKLMEEPNDLPGVKAMALSPDGKLLAWGDEEDNVLLWFSEVDKLVVVKDTTVSKPLPMVYKPYPKEAMKLAKEMYGVDLVSELKPAIAHKPIESITFNQDDVLLWMTMDYTLQRAHIRGGQVSVKSSKSLKLPPAMSSIITRDSVIQCEDRAKSVWEAFHSYGYELRQYDLETAEFRGACVIYPWRKYYHHVEVMALSSDGSLLAIASQDNSGLVRLEDFTLVQTFDMEFLSALAISPDNSRVALGRGSGLRAGESYKIIVLDVATGKVVEETVVRGSTPHAMAFESKDILWFYVWPSIYRMDIARGETKPVCESPGPNNVMLFDQRRRCIYLGGMFDGTVRIYQLPSAGTLANPEE